ncbi:unnamed protein product [Lymnaea stagnalis]|uniref:PDZ domain-containing protein n=1 Tax=Lymnaea stagnalis TaxID=6523 RepID=A0AAV2H602_LYMST
MSNVEYKPAEKLQIRLIRPDANSPWGFRLQGGIDFNTPLSIQSVNPGSVSERCGLKPGDAILSINNTTSDAMTHDEAKAEIMRSGNEIYMLVESRKKKFPVNKSPTPPPLFFFQNHSGGNWRGHHPRPEDVTGHQQTTRCKCNYRQQSQPFRPAVWSAQGSCAECRPRPVQLSHGTVLGQQHCRHLQ